MSKKILLSSIAAIAMSGAAHAAHFTGWYAGIEGGVSSLQDADFLFAQTNVAFNTMKKAEFDDLGWAVIATTGYAFSNNFRVEAEAGWRQNNNFATHGGAAITPPREGDIGELSLMANLLYDLQLTGNLSLSLGAGVGYDMVNLSDNVIDDSDWQFAYQGIVALNRKLTNRLDLSLAYRYLRVTGPEFSGAHGAHVDLYSFDDLEKDTLTLGLRYDLYEDEASAPVVETPVYTPAPAVKQFIVFFGFNKSNLTAEAQAVVAEAAANAKAAGSASILVVGHTDTSGSPAYNQRLSERRAASVKDELVRQGVSGTAISASGKGETELMVQTGDGVKEPQNRRATIDLN